MLSSSWLMWAALSAVCAALTSILIKTGLAKIEPDYATFIRTAVILVLLAGFITATAKWQNPLKLPPVGAAFLALSALATCGSWVCYFRAMKLAEASKVDPIDKSSVLLVAIFAALFLGERLAPLQWLGVALVGAGVVLLALKP